MSNSKWFAKLKIEHESRETERAELVRAASEILKTSKLSIFSLLRGDKTKAEATLIENQKIILGWQKRLQKTPSLWDEGVWRAALEEFAEAQVFLNYVQGGNIHNLNLKLDEEILLGALADATGESVRLAIRQAASFDIDSVERARTFTETVVELLTALDLTGNLRSKADAAKRNLQRLEELRLSLKLSARGR